MHRQYDAISSALPPLPTSSRAERMQVVVDLLWTHLASRGVSWVGFYLDRPDEPEETRLILGPSRDAPACSPIGLHGVCGQALVRKRTRIVRDVAELGPNYIACDPRDRSEIVIPLIDETETAWAVLDLDSREIGAFSESDDLALRGVLARAGLLPQRDVVSK